MNKNVIMKICLEINMQKYWGAEQRSSERSGKEGGKSLYVQTWRRSGAIEGSEFLFLAARCLLLAS